MDEKGCVFKKDVLRYEGDNKENKDYAVFNELRDLGLFAETETLTGKTRKVKTIQRTELDFESTLAETVSLLVKERAVELERWKEENVLRIVERGENDYRIVRNIKGKQVCKALAGKGIILCRTERKSEDQLWAENLHWEDVYDDQEGYNKIFYITKETAQRLIHEWGGQIIYQ
jgi:hypothetical protein